MANDIPIQAYEAMLKSTFENKMQVRPVITEALEQRLVQGESIGLIEGKFLVDYDLPLPELVTGPKKYDYLAYGYVEYRLYEYQKGITLNEKEVKFTENTLPEPIMNKAQKIGQGFNMLSQMMIEQLLTETAAARTSLYWSVPTCYDGEGLFSASHRTTNIVTSATAGDFSENALVEDLEAVVNAFRNISLQRNTDRKFWAGLTNYKLTLMVPVLKATKFEKIFEQGTIPILNATTNESYATFKDNIWSKKIAILPMDILTGNDYYVAVTSPMMPDIKPFMKLKWNSDSDFPDMKIFTPATSEAAFDGGYFKLSWQKWFTLVPFFWESIIKVDKT